MHVFQLILRRRDIASDATLFAKASPTRHANETLVLRRRETMLAGEEQPPTSIDRTAAPGQNTLGSRCVAVFATVLHFTETSIATV